jgi:hypothetical protein
MVTMIDELFDRSYRDGRARLNASLASGLSHLTDAVMNAFNVLNRIEYQAPWTARPKRAR